MHPTPKTPSKPAPAIALAPVKSSNIAQTGYHPESQTLAIQFKGGGKTYHYAGVPQSLVDDMGKAPSVGKFVGAHIVGKFKHTLQA